MDTSDIAIMNRATRRLVWRLIGCVGGGVVLAMTLVAHPPRYRSSLAGVALLTLLLLSVVPVFLGRRAIRFELRRDDIIGLGFLCSFIGFEGFRRIVGFIANLPYMPGGC